MGCIFSCISSIINFVFCQPFNQAIYTELLELNRLMAELKDQRETHLKANEKMKVLEQSKRKSALPCATF